MTWGEIAKAAQEATGPDRELDQQIFKASGICRPDADGILNLYRAPNYTSSVDAVLFLIASKLEDCEYEITTLYGVARVGICLNSEPGPFYGSNECGCVPLALVRAFALAMEAKP